MTLLKALASQRMRHWLPNAQDDAETCHEAAGVDMAQCERCAEHQEVVYKLYYNCDASYYVACCMSCEMRWNEHQGPR